MYIFFIVIFLFIFYIWQYLISDRTLNNVTYLWLACQAFAGLILRLVVPLDFVSDVTILEIPGGQLPCSRRVRTQRRYIYPSRG